MMLVKVNPGTMAHRRPLTRFSFDPFVPEFVKKQPAVNIVESSDHYRIEVAAPGLAKEDFKITLENEILSISAQKNRETQVEKENFTRREFDFFEFTRSFTLHDTIDQNSIQAAYDNGILTITLSKKAEAKAVNKTIEVQ